MGIQCEHARALQTCLKIDRSCRTIVWEETGQIKLDDTRLLAPFAADEAEPGTPDLAMLARSRRAHPPCDGRFELMAHPGDAELLAPLVIERS